MKYIRTYTFSKVSESEHRFAYHDGPDAMPPGARPEDVSETVGQEVNLEMETEQRLEGIEESLAGGISAENTVDTQENTNAVEQDIQKKLEMQGIPAESILFQMHQQHPEYAAESLSKPENKNILARYLLHLRELEKAAEAKISWDVLPGYGISTVQGKPFMYKLDISSAKLLAYAPGTYQELDLASGTWSGGEAPKGLDETYENLSISNNGAEFFLNMELETSLRKYSDADMSKLAADAQYWTPENTSLLERMGYAKPTEKPVDTDTQTEQETTLDTTTQDIERPVETVQERIENVLDDSVDALRLELATNYRSGELNSILLTIEGLVQAQLADVSDEDIMEFLRSEHADMSQDGTYRVYIYEQAGERRFGTQDVARNTRERQMLDTREVLKDVTVTLRNSLQSNERNHAALTMALLSMTELVRTKLSQVDSDVIMEYLEGADAVRSQDGTFEVYITQNREFGIRDVVQSSVDTGAQFTGLEKPDQQSESAEISREQIQQLIQLFEEIVRTTSPDGLPGNTDAVRDTVRDAATEQLSALSEFREQLQQAETLLANEKARFDELIQKTGVLSMDELHELTDIRKTMAELRQKITDLKQKIEALQKTAQSAPEVSEQDRVTMESLPNTKEELQEMLRARQEELAKVRAETADSAQVPDSATYQQEKSAHIARLEADIRLIQLKLQSLDRTTTVGTAAPETEYVTVNGMNVEVVPNERLIRFNLPRALTAEQQRAVLAVKERNRDLLQDVQVKNNGRTVEFTLTQEVQNRESQVRTVLTVLQAAKQPRTGLQKPRVTVGQVADMSTPNVVKGIVNGATAPLNMLTFGAVDRVRALPIDASTDQYVDAVAPIAGVVYRAINPINTLSAFWSKN